LCELRHNLQALGCYRVFGGNCQCAQLAQPHEWGQQLCTILQVLNF
jgi:hypothetical protein